MGCDKFPIQELSSRKHTEHLGLTTPPLLKFQAILVRDKPAKQWP
jgi:hypothetical protein